MKIGVEIIAKPPICMVEKPGEEEADITHVDHMDAWHSGLQEIS
jgi:hypothetical protein